MAYMRLPPSAYIFVRDSAVALAPDSFECAMCGYAVWLGYRELGYTGAHIVVVRERLYGISHFLVLDSPEKQ